MKRFNAPQLEVVRFGKMDVLTASHVLNVCRVK